MGDDLLLKDFEPRSELVVSEHPVSRAKFPVIDAHNHLGLWGGDAEQTAQKVAEMDAVGVRATIDLDGNRRGPLDESLKALKQAHPGLFVSKPNSQVECHCAFARPPFKISNYGQHLRRIPPYLF